MQKKVCRKKNKEEKKKDEMKSKKTRGKSLHEEPEPVDVMVCTTAMGGGGWVGWEWFGVVHACFSFKMKSINCIVHVLCDINDLKPIYLLPVHDPIKRQIPS